MEKTVAFNWISKSAEMMSALTELDVGFMLVLVGLCALVLGAMALYVAILALKR